MEIKYVEWGVATSAAFFDRLELTEANSSRGGMAVKYFEYGRGNDTFVVMLHSGGTSYKGMEPTAKLLGERFHVLLVAYDGFNPSEPDTQFVSPWTKPSGWEIISCPITKARSMCFTACPTAAGF